MDLINRKIFKIKSNEEKHLIIELDETNYSSLTLDEKDVFDIFKTIAKDNLLDLSNVKDYLSDEHNAEWFNNRIKSWKNDVVYEHLSKSRLKQFFNNKGNKIALYYSIACIIIGVLFAALFYMVTGLNTTGGIIGLIGSVFLFISGFVIYILPEDIFWTMDKRRQSIYMLKWKNFKKFLSDNSLMKEHPRNQ